MSMTAKGRGAPRASCRKKLFLTYAMKMVAPKPPATTTHKFAGVAQNRGLIPLASG